MIPSQSFSLAAVAGGWWLECPGQVNLYVLAASSAALPAALRPRDLNVFCLTLS